jgi:uncharacterized protein YndB with AHSA1/START domain
MDKLTVESSIWIDAPRQDVWRAITETQHIQHWWGDDSYGKIAALQAGAAIEFGTDAVPGTLVVIDPPRELVYQRWDVIPMTTRYLLEEENGGTRLTVSEKGLEAILPILRLGK